MSKIKFNSILQKALIIFIIVQPIFDLKIFYNSISTLIRVIAIGAFFVFYFIQDTNKKKYLLLIYPALLFIYFIFHDMNAVHNFKSLFPGNFNYSSIKEMLYFAKMIMPFLLIYNIYQAKLNKEQIIKIIKSIVIIMSSIIIITNISGISYGSYSDTKIKANFFSWFNNNENYTYQDLSSKGLFEYANQISAVLIIFLPFMMLEIEKNKNKILNISIIVLNVWALILLGTKVAVLGIIVDIIFAIFVLIFDNVMNKKEINIKNLAFLIIPIIFYIASLPFNPMFDRQNERKMITKSSETTANTVIEESPIENNADLDAELNEMEVKKNNIKIIAQEKSFHTEFYTDYYSYEYDIDFWNAFIQNDKSLLSDYRYVEEEIIKRVIEINDNKLDKWFGITNTRLQNIFNIEKDFVVQYYALGIIGIVLVFAPYVTILGCSTIKILKNKFKNIERHQYLSFGLTIFAFGIAYYSGNLLNSLSFTVYFAILITLLFKNVDK